jgi:hypothetical protein
MQMEPSEHTQWAAISWKLAFRAGGFEGRTTDAAHVLAAGDVPLPGGDHVPFLDPDFHIGMRG